MVNAGIILLLAYLLPQITVKSFWTALWVALLVAILNVLVGWLLSVILNVVTLGLITSIVQLIVSAVVIKLADKLVRNFEIKGFWPALVIAIALAAANYLIDGSDNDREDISGFTPKVELTA